MSGGPALGHRDTEVLQVARRLKPALYTVLFVSFAIFVLFVVYFALNGAGRANRAASIVPLV